MSITIELKPEIEARLLAQAKAQSVSVEHLLEILIEGCVFSLQPQQSAPKDRLAVLKALGKSPSLARRHCQRMRSRVKVFTANEKMLSYELFGRYKCFVATNQLP